MLLAIITAVIAYQRAKAAGRNGWLWALIGAAVYIGAQLLVGIAAGIFFLFGIAIFDWPESIFADYEMLFNIIGIVAAIGASWLLIKYLDRVPQPQPTTMPPPPPSFAGERIPDAPLARED